MLMLIGQILYNLSGLTLVNVKIFKFIFTNVKPDKLYTNIDVFCSIFSHY